MVPKTRPQNAPVSEQAGHITDNTNIAAIGGAR